MFGSLWKDRLWAGTSGRAQQYAQAATTASDATEPQTSDRRFWVSGYGGNGRIGALPSQPATEFDGGGGAAGFEADRGVMTFGLAAGYGATNTTAGGLDLDTRSTS